MQANVCGGQRQKRFVRKALSGEKLREGFFVYQGAPPRNTSGAVQYRQFMLMRPSVYGV
jgi:hypothetical protein